MDESKQHSPLPTLRPAAEVQEAHDILISIILGEIKIGLSPDDPSLRSAADVLCWVLGHDHNQAFAGNLVKIKAAMEARGYVTINTGRPISREQFRKIYKRKH